MEQPGLRRGSHRDWSDIQINMIDLLHTLLILMQMEHQKSICEETSIVQAMG